MFGKSARGRRACLIRLRRVRHLRRVFLPGTEAVLAPRHSCFEGGGLNSDAPASRRILLATRNAHKTGEVRAILGDGWIVEDLLAHPELPDVEETGATFAENAALKAVAASRHFPDGWVVADDSGLEVDALNGEPGVYSARYAGPRADDEANRQKLVRELRTALQANPGRLSTARFRCCIVVARNGEVAGQFDGTVEGLVIPAARGEGGFGYDPLFIPEGYQDTFSELPPEVKNRLSHRGKALRQAAEFLRREG